MDDHTLSYQGCCSAIKKIVKMLVCGIGIRDISYIEYISVNKVLSVLINSDKTITPKQQHYDSLEVDEFWTYVGNKKNKIWLIYAYHRKQVSISMHDYKTAKKLRDKLKSMDIGYDRIYTDKWDSFIDVFLSR